jgi:hypothetical protein
MSEIRFDSGGNWNTVANAVHAWDGSDWDTTINKVHSWNGSEWQELWPLTVPPTPSPGDHVLSPSSSSIGDYSGYAEFNTEFYRGYIDEIRIRISWGGYGNFPRQIDVSGRPSGNFYRDIYNDTEWDGRTIDHRIDTFDASSLTEFNNGSAYGFSIALSGGLIMEINSIQLVLTVH